MNGQNRSDIKVGKKAKITISVIAVLLVLSLVGNVFLFTQLQQTQNQLTAANLATEKIAAELDATNLALNEAKEAITSQQAEIAILKQTIEKQAIEKQEMEKQAKKTAQIETPKPKPEVKPESPKPSKPNPPPANNNNGLTDEEMKAWKDSLGVTDPTINTTADESDADGITGNSFLD